MCGLNPHVDKLYINTELGPNQARFDYKSEFFMKVVIQVVTSASVTVEDKLISEIGKGLLVFVGLHMSDTEDMFDSLIKKIVDMRIFSDDAGKINHSVADVGGEVLLVSQFSLNADCNKGNRPSFAKAMPPAKAKTSYEKFVSRFKELYGSDKVKDGVFGAYMQVALINDGPMTILY